MKFIPTPNVWNPAISSAIQNGQLKLQKGQWVKCGEGAKPSRFIKRGTSGSIWAVHPEAGGKIPKDRLAMAFRCW